MELWFGGVLKKKHAVVTGLVVKCRHRTQTKSRIGKFTVRHSSFLFPLYHDFIVFYFRRDLLL